jgi:predicted enzyme related to lactoylglutathione lyase
MRPVRAVEVCVDVLDPRPVVAFWSELLGYRAEGDLDARWVHLEPPDGLPVLNLQRVPEAKAGKNRLHLDVFVDDPLDWIERAESLGAARLSLHDDPADWFCVMADPAGNEFCICQESQD